MKRLFLIIVTIISILFTSCTKVGDYRGYLSIKATDDPFDISLVESATITINRIDVRQSCEDCTDKPFIILSTDEITLDLLDLRNGITEELVNLSVPRGKYDLVRLYITEASLLIKGNASPFVVKIPSGQSTGIKIFINPEVEVVSMLTSELLLDFDLSNSFKMLGNPVNGFIFKPVIRAVNNSIAGKIEGKVLDASSIIVPDAKVWIKQDTTIATTFSDITGLYRFVGVPAGNYDLYGYKEGFDTTKYINVEVLEANLTSKDIILNK